MPNINKLQDLIMRMRLLVGGAFLAACSTESLITTANKEDGLNYEQIQTHQITLSALIRNTNTQNFRVYLDGDGIPWRQGEPSRNPTGKTKLGLQLFLRDPNANLYLSRPCYDITPMPPSCTTQHWTSGRYSAWVVNALTEAIRQQAGAKPIELVGYSGGGTLAVLIAQDYAQVNRVLTVASNLDHQRWTELHQSPPLVNSLNPSKQGSSRAEELHLFGARDIEVPPSMNQDYFRIHTEARFGVTADFDHHCCWINYWPAILAEWDQTNRGQ